MTFLIIYLTLFLIWIILIKMAPDGYEDEKGFHYSKSNSMVEQKVNNELIVEKQKIQFSRSA